MLPERLSSVTSSRLFRLTESSVSRWRAWDSGSTQRKCLFLALGDARSRPSGRNVTDVTGQCHATQPPGSAAARPRWCCRLCVRGLLFGDSTATGTSARRALPLRGELQVAGVPQVAGSPEAPAHRLAQRAARVPVLGDPLRAPEVHGDPARRLPGPVPVKRNEKLPVPDPRPAGGAGPPSILHSSPARALRRGQSGP